MQALRANMTYEAAWDPKMRFDVLTLFPDLVRQAMTAVFGGGIGMDAAGASMMANDEAMMKMMASFPIGRLAGFPGV